MKNETKGVLLAIAAGATFGLIPLFSLPAMAAGMGAVSVIFFRFLFGAAFLLVYLVTRGESLAITKKDYAELTALSLMYVVSSITLYNSYSHISSGVATSLVYTNPVWCCLLGLLFLHERLTLRKVSSMVIAVVGVMFLTGFFADDARFNTVGVLLGMVSGMTYGIYLLVIPRMKTRRMKAMKFTFYIFLLNTIYVGIYAMLFDGGLMLPPTPMAWGDMVMLGLVPAVISNVTLAMSLKLVDSSVVAILGAFEPLTAMVVGMVVFAEPCTVDTFIGVVLILTAVTILTISPQKHIIGSHLWRKRRIA